MDTSLLQTREPGAPRQVPPANNGPSLEPAAAEAERQYQEHVASYHDLAIEPPQPPLRMRLDPPIEYDGETYKELLFDFDALNGKDFQNAERTFAKLYKAEKNEVVLPEMKHLYHCILAAQTADVPIGLIMKLPRRYYQPLRMQVLKACGSSPEEENE
jgi:hypothetical protein